MPSMDTGEATDALADTETYLQAGAGLAGYMGGSIVQNIVEPRFDAPDEMYGLVVIGLAALIDGVPYRNAIMVGGGVHAAENAAERAGVRSTVASVGEGM